MDQQAESTRASWVPWLLMLLVLVISLALALPVFLRSGRVSNDRRDWMRLKMLCSAEADFRANDRDWNHVNDYWTGDVKGLYTLTSCAAPGAQGLPDDPPIKLIELSVAAADADGTLVTAGGENTSIGTVTVPSQKSGYWYAALTLDLSATGAEATYRQDTGGTPAMGRCHHRTKFGFVALPDSESAGPYAYIVNQENVLYRRPTVGSAKTTHPSAVPPGLDGFNSLYQNWPTDLDLKSWWSRFD